MSTPSHTEATVETKELGNDSVVILQTSRITVDAELRMREFLNEDVVREYTELYKDNVNFPPLVAFTTWHYGVNDGMTACGRYVPKEDKAWVETAPAKQTSCKQCLNRYATKEAIKEQP